MKTLFYFLLLIKYFIRKIVQDLHETNCVKALIEEWNSQYVKISY